MKLTPDALAAIRARDAACTDLDGDADPRDVRALLAHIDAIAAERDAAAFLARSAAADVCRGVAARATADRNALRAEITATPVRPALGDVLRLAGRADRADARREGAEDCATALRAWALAKGTP